MSDSGQNPEQSQVSDANQNPEQVQVSDSSKSPPQADQYANTFWRGVLFGAAIGGFLGLWYAPSSGEETLNRLSQRVSDVKNTLLERVRGESIEDSLQEGRALAHQHRAHSAFRLDEPRS